MKACVWLAAAGAALWLGSACSGKLDLIGDPPQGTDGGVPDTATSTADSAWVDSRMDNANDASPQEADDAQYEGESDAEPKADAFIEQDASLPEALDGDIWDMSIYDMNLGETLMTDSDTHVQGCYDCTMDQCSDLVQQCASDSACSEILACVFIEN